MLGHVPGNHHIHKFRRALDNRGLEHIARVGTDTGLTKLRENGGFYAYKEKQPDNRRAALQGRPSVASPQVARCWNSVNPALSFVHDQRCEGLESWLTSSSNESQVPSKQRTNVRSLGQGTLGAEPSRGMEDIFENEGQERQAWAYKVAAPIASSSVRIDY